MNIRTATALDADLIARLVSEANRDVAERFKLTADNCPKHPSFCTAEWIRSDMARGEVYFVASLDGEPVACVATEYPNPGLAYLNRLAVLPSHRRRGLGTALTNHVLALAGERGACTVGIGLIGERLELQNGYQSLGFVAVELGRFPHLRFTVRETENDA